LLGIGEEVVKRLLVITLDNVTDKILFFKGIDILSKREKKKD